MFKFFKSLLGIGPGQLNTGALYATVYKAKADPRTGLQYRVRLVDEDGEIVMNWSGFNVARYEAMITAQRMAGKTVYMKVSE